jgi:hypothetical protein
MTNASKENVIHPKFVYQTIKMRNGMVPSYVVDGI